MHFLISCLIFLVFFSSSCTTPDATQKSQVVKDEKKEKKQSLEPLFQGDVETVLKKYAENHKETTVEVETRLGSIKIKFYEDVPLHRANFLRLAEAGYFNNVEFNRVIKDFMVQGGGTDKKNPVKIGKYLIPSEVKEGRYHKIGTVAMAKPDTNNPSNASSPNDFYIVQGRKFTPQELDAIIDHYKIALNKEQYKIYTTIGGAPHLDGTYTIIGEVVEGMDVVNAIAEEPVDKGSWPLTSVGMKVHVLQ